MRRYVDAQFALGALETLVVIGNCSYKALFQ